VKKRGVNEFMGCVLLHSMAFRYIKMVRRHRILLYD
jgi:hypothetical protein